MKSIVNKYTYYYYIHRNYFSISSPLNLDIPYERAIVYPAKDHAIPAYIYIKIFIILYLNQQCKWLLTFYGLYEECPCRGLFIPPKRVCVFGGVFIAVSNATRIRISKSNCIVQSI